MYLMAQGKQTTPLRIETSERKLQPLNWMLADKNYNIVMGDITAIFRYKEIIIQSIQQVSFHLFQKAVLWK